jgi:hypothetical protein
VILIALTSTIFGQDNSIVQKLLIEQGTVIKEGTLVKAYVESVEKARAFGKEGYLKIQFVNTTAIDGSKVQIKAMKGSITGEEKLDASIALSVIVSPLFLLKKGSQAKVNEGKIMRVVVTKDTYISLVK